jgi:glycosyltransferase involved in cell wall biosynthesis
LRILFVAFPNSIHTARWINQVSSEEDFDIHLFSAYQAPVNLHPEIRNITYHRFCRCPGNEKHENVRVRSIFPFSWGCTYLEKLLSMRFPHFYENFLTRLIKRLQPDIIHSHEFQHGAYLTLVARGRLKDFPTWIVSNWGSDIFLFGRLKEHKEKIKEVLRSCDYYASECQRDNEIARRWGFKGQILPAFPIAGGHDLSKLDLLRTDGPISKRRVIAVKGAQDFAGRAIFAIKAISACEDILKDYQIVFFNNSPEMLIAIELLAQDTGLNVTAIPRVSNEEILRLHGRARASIGLSISDSFNGTLREAMMMGSFPITSKGSCAPEWIETGRNGWIVDPENVDEIVTAIRQAVQDDAMVDGAAEMNDEITRKHLNEDVIKPQVIQYYRDIYREIQSGRK